MLVVINTEGTLAVNGDLANGHTDLVSDDAKTLMQLITRSILGHVLCAFGIITNVINIVIFIKQGFTETVNISLLALAISDLCSLITMEWVNILDNPLLRSSGIPWDIQEFMSMTGGAPRSSFARVTSWITAFITFERCLCLMVPFKVRRIITGRVTVVTMVIIYICMLLTHVPDYASSYFGWKFHPNNNRTLLGLLFRKNRSESQGVSFILAVLAQIVSFILVILLTVVLVTEMKRKSKWRQEVTAGDSKMSERRQKREDRVVRMIVLISCTYIVCFLPGIVVYIGKLFEPALNPRGQYRNTVSLIWSIVAILEATNSSVNIFVYYTMSTKYKATFHRIFGKRVCSSKTNTTNTGVD